MSARFPIRHEFRRHTTAFTGFAQEAGTVVKWYRFDRAKSVSDDVYDEESEDAGFVFHPARYVIALNVDTPEGVETKSEGGSYTTDIFRGVFSVEHLRRAGLPDINVDVSTDRSILKDRLVYDRRLWSPRDIQFQGNVGDINLTFTMICEEIDDDEFSHKVLDFSS